MATRHDVSVHEYKHELLRIRSDGLKASDPETDYVGEERSGFASLTDWTLEILTCVCSLATLSSIIVILWKAHNKPVDHWPLPISLSATITTLSTISTAAMMHNVSAFISQ